MKPSSVIWIDVRQLLGQQTKFVADDRRGRREEGTGLADPALAPLGDAGARRQVLEGRSKILFGHVRAQGSDHRDRIPEQAKLLLRPDANDDLGTEPGLIEVADDADRRLVQRTADLS